MHPAIQHDLAQAKIADLHRQAQHDALARAASQARNARAQRSHSVRFPAVAARRVLVLLAGARQRRIAAQGQRQP
jgi:hypothetical protein